MEYNPDLQREILRFIRDHENPNGGRLTKPLSIDGYDDATMRLNTLCLYEDGLIKANISDPIGNNPKIIMPLAPTSEGYRAIAETNDEAAWRRGLRAVAALAIPFTLKAVYEFLKAEVAKHLKLP